MKNIPMFVTEYGVASLFLREIPYCGEAHIKILSSLEPEALLHECISFCIACGANKINACGADCLKKYSVSATLIEMLCAKESLSETSAALFPVTDKTAGRWREIYNEKMISVPNASYMTKADEKELLSSGDGYFVHKEGQLLGIGRAADGEIRVVASVQKGGGADTALALASVLSEDTAKLMVAKENERAVRLYERLGFVAVKEVSKWYKIL